MSGFYFSNTVGDFELRAAPLLFLAGILAQGPALAKENQVRRGPLPAWVVPSDPLLVPSEVNGPAFMRRQDVIMHIDAQGEQQYNGYRFKILHPNALQGGNIAITWNPAAGNPVVHAINVYREAEVIDVLKNTSFEVLRREDQLEAARLDGVLTAVLRVPDLRVGDELEVAYTTPASDPTLGRYDAGALMLGPSPGPGRYRLELSWGRGLEPKLKMTPDMAAAAVHQNGGVVFRFDNPAMLSPPKDAPPRYQIQRLVEFSEIAEWPAVSRLFAPLFSRASTLEAKSPVKAEATRIAAAHATPLERASAALKLVQHDVRYIYVGLDRGNFTPATADETWQRRYGDCKAKTALLLALLKELDIPAEPVLASNRGDDDGMDERLPNPRLFDHVLVKAQIGGKSYWLDGTLPPVVAPTIAPSLPYRWVLPVTAEGRGLEPVEWRPANRPEEIEIYDIDARAGFDKPARVTNTSVVRGIKGLQQQAQFSAIDASQLLAVLRQQLTGATWQSVDDVKWRYDEKSQASIMSVTGTWGIKWDDDGNGAKSFALPGGGFSPPDKRARSADQSQDAPFYNAPEYDCTLATVHVPSATGLQNWSTNSGYDVHIFGKNYYRAFEKRDGSLRMVRGYRVERIELDAATARKDNELVASFDNSMAWAFYNPAKRAPSVFGGKSVPAANEIDWTIDEPPCLAALSAR